jgi:2,4-dienoyl-CoA reductase-like NADH-dependent reductase (Old Yellow Enzyme family)
MKQINEKLLKAVTLGSGKVVKNAMVMAPMTTFSGNADGTVSDAELSYYKARSKDIGMVITATTYVSESGKGFQGQFGAYSDHFVPSLRQLAETIKGEGALAILQIFHAGRMALPNEIPNGETISASAVAPVREGAVVPKAMTDEEILNLITAFGETTKRAIEAGFDGVEIHGANTYLLQQFYSPHSNRREDQWGGSVEKRMTLPLNVINEVKRVAKNEGKEDFVIGYRFSPEELENPGITLAETLKFVDVLSDQKLDYLHVSTMNFWQGSSRNPEDKTPVINQLVETVAKRVPLISVGSIHTPLEALKALESGVNFVALGREIIMEPEWMAKVIAEKHSDIRTTLNLADRAALDIPEPLWNAIVNTQGWFPIEE